MCIVDLPPFHVLNTSKDIVRTILAVLLSTAAAIAVIVTITVISIICVMRTRKGAFYYDHDIIIVCYNFIPFVHTN